MLLGRLQEIWYNLIVFNYSNDYMDESHYITISCPFLGKHLLSGAMVLMDK
mgnify:CR=1 FL=1